MSIADAQRRLAAAVLQEVAKDGDPISRFQEPGPTAPAATVRRANNLVDDANIETHEFFRRARQDKRLLRLWAGQEAVVTGPFSQLLLVVAAGIKNVHLRAAIMQVIDGEHGPLKSGVAVKAHPWLLHKLCTSMSLTAIELTAIPPTVQFLSSMADATGDIMSALGLFGVGNERMLIPEYSAVEECFASSYPEADASHFLQANIMEDADHTRIIEEIAQVLITQGYNEERYLDGARKGVAARITYYDELLKWFESNHSLLPAG